MQETKIYIESFDYELPDEKIAKYPLEERDMSKLLVYQNNAIREDIFRNAADYLPDHALLVYNDTKVIQARMIFRKGTGARIEIFCLEPVNPADYALSLGSTSSCEWKCMVGNLKKWKSGLLTREIHSEDQEYHLSAELLCSEGNTHTIRFSWNNVNISFAEILEQAGELPIPPYLHRETEEKDKTTYQTVYAKIKGSVAAPTAGLHFTEKVFNQLRQKNINTCELTLHVGAGTFQPVKSNDIAEHTMHTEVISVRLSALKQLHENADNIIAVGTTSVRTLESLYYIGLKIIRNETEPGSILEVSQWEPYEKTSDISAKVALEAVIAYLEERKLTVLHARTQIMIRPGYQFRLTGAMFTNFHQPKSTLLLLVSAFTGENWKAIYDHALTNNFRFLSYGDSSLLIGAIFDAKNPVNLK
jgi:S-adenosylmethionine:tRNA ribosyltransferase-isomerase